MTPLLLVAACALSLSASANALAQGLVDLAEKPSRHSSAPPGASTPRSRPRLQMADGRLDLAVSPNVRPLLGEPATRTITLGASAQWSPVCGKFDLQADFKALLGKEAREEYLEGFVTAGVGEVLGSGMELLCQSMPTACSILQNNNIAANLKLLYSNDLCRSLEDAVLTGSRRGRAEAIHRCLERKLAEGKTKDEASRACLREHPETSGFDGRLVAELDLNLEIRRYLSFTDGGGKLLEALTQERRETSGALNESLRPNAVAERYELLREGYEKAWTRVLEKARSGAPALPPAAPDDATPVAAAAADALGPAGTPPLSPLELELLAKRPAWELQALVASLSSAAALLALTRELNEVERKLEALATSPALEGSADHGAYLGRLLGRLRAERERLLRLYADQERFAQLLGSAHALGQAELGKARREALRQALLRESALEKRLATRPFGTPDVVPSAPRPGPGPRSPRSSLPVAPVPSSPARAAPGDACEGCGMDSLDYAIGAPR